MPQLSVNNAYRLPIQITEQQTKLIIILIMSPFFKLKLNNP